MLRAHIRFDFLIVKQIQSQNVSHLTPAGSVPDRPQAEDVPFHREPTAGRIFNKRVLSWKKKQKGKKIFENYELTP